MLCINLSIYIEGKYLLTGIYYENFINNNQSTINILSLLLFILKILSYPYFILEAFLLYFVRIYKLFKYFVFINILKKQIIKKLKVN